MSNSSFKNIYVILKNTYNVYILLVKNLFQEKEYQPEDDFRENV